VGDAGGENDGQLGGCGGVGGPTAVGRVRCVVGLCHQTGDFLDGKTRITRLSLPTPPAHSVSPPRIGPPNSLCPSQIRQPATGGPQMLPSPSGPEHPTPSVGVAPRSPVPALLQPRPCHQRRRATWRAGPRPNLGLPPTSPGGVLIPIYTIRWLSVSSQPCSVQA